MRPDHWAWVYLKNSKPFSSIFEEKFALFQMNEEKFIIQNRTTGSQTKIPKGCRVAEDSVYTIVKEQRPEAYKLYIWKPDENQTGAPIIRDCTEIVRPRIYHDRGKIYFNLLLRPSTLMTRDGRWDGQNRDWKCRGSRNSPAYFFCPAISHDSA